MSDEKFLTKEDLNELISCEEYQAGIRNSILWRKKKDLILEKFPLLKTAIEHQEGSDTLMKAAMDSIEKEADGMEWEE